jgi:hypothetical protein
LIIFRHEPPRAPFFKHEDRGELFDKYGNNKMRKIKILITIMTIKMMADDDDDERFIGYLTGVRKP